MPKYTFLMLDAWSDDYKLAVLASCETEARMIANGLDDDAVAGALLSVEGQPRNRIKELAEQAGYGIWNLDNQELAVMKKFAELIVKECAGIYDKIDNGNLHMGTDNYLSALQKHFGAEQ